MTSESSDRFSSFRTGLGERAAADRLRSLEPLAPIPGTPFVRLDGRRFLNFCSNDYLGMSGDPQCIEAAALAARTHGVGAGASRLVSGSLDVHEALEAELAEFTRRPSALLFSSGFQANTSIIPAVTRRRGLILSDQGVHNSLIQGCRLSRAEVHTFRHNDVDHLRALLRAHGPETDAPPLVLTESLFSMDGDESPLDRIGQIAEEHGALLLVDDAHALGVLGRDGRGLAAAHPRVDLLVGTFGKALGVAGAFVACAPTLRDHLVNHGSGFIYSTAPPPPTIGAVRAALGRLRSGGVDLEAFSTFVRTAHDRLRSAGFDTEPSRSHIVPIRLGSDAEALACSEILRERGLLAVAIRPPTVPEGTARLRISLNRLHTEEHVDALVSALLHYRRQRGGVSSTGAAG